MKYPNIMIKSAHDVEACRMAISVIAQRQDVIKGICKSGTRGAFYSADIELTNGEVVTIIVDYKVATNTFEVQFAQ